ncbi:MAG TPA: pyridoxamine 5'-phosphate oxidase family protein [Bacteroidia bacterium]|nr:pyridoxamine 5'-phosphate oxidase family protein [Bacteroidia bacterium]
MQPTEKTTITRLAKRADYNEATIYSILDDAMLCTVSYNDNSQPFAIPTAFCRIDDYLYIHGSVGAGYMRKLAAGAPACITVMLADALVLAKSVFDHSINYRSVVAFAKAELVTDETERMKALEVFTNKLIPGRWETSRIPNDSEMRKTMVLKFKLDEASAKVRSGAPSGEPEDNTLPYWSGLIHLCNGPTDTEPDDLTKSAGIEYPGYFGL